MNELQVFNFNHVDVVDSREVAQWTERNHKDLLRDIHRYIEVMEKNGERKIAPSSFFIPSTYINSQNKEQPCYLLTKKGCDMVANKMTGEKGVLFTAAYVTAFEKMREKMNPALPKDYPSALRALADAEEKKLALQTENKQLQTAVSVQRQQIAELTPKATYYDLVLNCHDLVSISVIAKDYGWSAVRMNQYLHGRGIQFRQGDIWLLYQKYADKGYTSTKTHSYPGSDGLPHTKTHTYWTQKGRLFLYELLKSDGVLPRIEQEAA